MWWDERLDLRLGHIYMHRFIYIFYYCFANSNRKWLGCQNASHLGHLVVSCHQVLNSLSIYGGYMLDVGAFLLVNAHIRALHRRKYTLLWPKWANNEWFLAVSLCSIDSTWSDTACSWATMMCSCPRACRRSGSRDAWCACRAVGRMSNHKKVQRYHDLAKLWMFVLMTVATKLLLFFIQPCVVFSLHCSVARASSSLFTMMVCCGVAARFFRVGWAWLWRRSMWNFRWPLRLNLRFDADDKMLTQPFAHYYNGV